MWQALCFSSRWYQNNWWEPVARNSGRARPLQPSRRQPWTYHGPMLAGENRAIVKAQIFGDICDFQQQASACGQDERHFCETVGIELQRDAGLIVELVLVPDEQAGRECSGSPQRLRAYPQFRRALRNRQVFSIQDMVLHPWR